MNHFTLSQWLLILTSNYITEDELVDLVYIAVEQKTEGNTKLTLAQIHILILTQLSNRF